MPDLLLCMWTPTWWREGKMASRGSGPKMGKLQEARGYKATRSRFRVERYNASGSATRSGTQAHASGSTSRAHSTGFPVQQDTRFGCRCWLLNCRFAPAGLRMKPTSTGDLEAEARQALACRLYLILRARSTSRRRPCHSAPSSARIAW